MEAKLNSSIERFVKLGAENKWNEFDKLIFEIKDQKEWLDWVEKGNWKTDPRTDVKDLAISILEKTEDISEINKKDLENIENDGTENLHLRRKSAIALFRHGDRRLFVIDRLKDALSDEWLKDEASEYLASL